MKLNPKKLTISQDGKELTIEGMPLTSLLTTTAKQGKGINTFMSKIPENLLIAFESYNIARETFQMTKKQEKVGRTMKVNGEEWAIESDLIMCAVLLECYRLEKDSIELTPDDLMQLVFEFEALLCSLYVMKTGALDKVEFEKDDWNWKENLSIVVNEKWHDNMTDMMAKNPKSFGVSEKEIELAIKLKNERLKTK